uniref:Uncharacterized protein n=1 Tax=Cucumis melo TaxID=3656 RepID=A0A9I9EJP8_CUCME
RSCGWRRKKLWLEAEEGVVGGERRRPWRRKKASLEVEEGVLNVENGKDEEGRKSWRIYWRKEKIAQRNEGGEIHAN